MFSYSTDFAGDSEFLKLLDRRFDVDLTVLALEVARDAYPKLNFAHTLEWIAQRGRELAAPLAGASGDRDALKILARSLSGTHGLHGSKDAYGSAESSYLHRVIETGVGIPISLSMVYMSVAQACGLDLAGVAAPMHFLTRYDAPEGPLFVDAFYNGRILSYADAIRWLHTISDCDHDEIEASLEPASPRDVAARMLNNLKALHIRNEHWDAAWRVQRRLTALEPAAFDTQRDLGLVALKANRPGEAIDLFEACLPRCPGDERTLVERHLNAARKLLATLN